MPRLALVHDWLTGMRGGERALEVVCERFPGAELFTLVHVPGSVSPAIERRPIHTSFIQKLPFVKRWYRLYLPLFPSAVERFNFDRFDLILSLSHCCVKSIIHPASARHLCYCLTPMRYAWDQFDAYFGPDRIGAIGSRLMRPVMGHLAKWDRETAGRVDRYLAISHYVAGRIGRYYNREATVVYPPVNTDFFRPGAVQSERFALVVSALVPYKRIDLAIDACARAGVPLKVVGSGPERGALERSARGQVEFLGRFSDTRSGTSTAAPPSCCCRAKKTSASCRSRRRPADGRSSRSAAAARSKRWCPMRPACSLTNPPLRRLPTRSRA